MDIKAAHMNSTLKKTGLAVIIIAVGIGGMIGIKSNGGREKRKSKSRYPSISKCAKRRINQL